MSKPLPVSRYDKGCTRGTKEQNAQDKAAHGRMVGENQYNSKLTSSDVAKIREMKPTTTIPSLADMFRVSTSTIEDILYGRSWKEHSQPPPNFPRVQFGVPGDRLWVKETWRVGAWHESQRIAVDYRADGYARREWLNVPDERMFERLIHQSIEDAKAAGMNPNFSRLSWDPGEGPTRWRSSRFMPRWASRITLEITDIRVERLQEITEIDCLKEGLGESDQLSFIGESFPDENQRGLSPLQRAFRSLWDSLYGPAAWERDKDKWVWVIGYKVLPEGGSGCLRWRREDERGNEQL
jgi:hypothetical protein